MSDLLLLREPQLGLPAERIADLALGTTTIRAGTRIGIYWETYFAADSAAPVEVTVQATRLDTPWYEQVGHLLRLGGGPQTPVAVRFADATRPNDATTGRSIGLTWPPNATGTYRLEVTVRAGDRAATAATEVSVVRP
jgi:hypothetical protein